MKNFKYILILVSICSLGTLRAQNSVGVGTTTPNNKAILDIVSTSKGILIPRIDTSTLNTIGTTLTAAEDGMLVYASDVNAFVYWDGDSLEWYLLNENVINGNADDDWNILGDTIYSGRDYVAIGGGASPTSKVTIESFKEYALEVINNSSGTNSSGLYTEASGGTDFNIGITSIAYSSGGDTVAGINAEARNIDNFGIGVRGYAEGFGSSGNIYGGVFEASGGATDTVMGLIASGANGSLNYAAFFSSGDVFVQDTLRIGNSPAFPGSPYILADTTGGGKLVWVPAPSGGGGGDIITDADGDTYVRVEDAPDNDVIRFSTGSGSDIPTVFFEMDSGKFNVYNTGLSVFMGDGAGAYDDLTANRNVFIGYRSGYLSQTGTYNTSVGANAFYNNISGSYNNAFGNAALYSNSTGNTNVAIGGSALYANLSGGSNIAIGYSALSSNVGGNNSTAIGYQAMANANDNAASFTSYNVAIGYQSLRGSAIPSSNTGNYNTAVGSQTLYTNTSGHSNTAMGQYALRSNTTGYYNTAIGRLSMYLNQDGRYNTALGMDAIRENVSAHYNTGIGYRALRATTSGGNTALGYTAGFTNISGTNNTFIGTSADATNSALTNAAAIGFNAKVNTSNSMVLGDTSNVYVGIGTGSPTAKLDVRGEVRIVDGTQGAGLVLTSDASGYASWQPASGADADWTISGSTMYNTTQQVAIGTTTPGLIAGSTKYLTLSAAPSSMGSASFEIHGGSSTANGLQSKIDFIARTTAPSTVNTARIEVTNSASNTGHGVMRFYTNAGSGITERMTILQNGYVGVGTNNPLYPMQINTTLNDADLHVYSSGSFASVDVESKTGSSSLFRLAQNGSIKGGISYYSPTNTIKIFNYGNGAEPGIHLDPSDNVGIGTSTPAQKLDVEGAVEVDDEYRYESSKLRYITLGPPDFVDQYSDLRNVRRPGGYYMYFSNGTAGSNAYAYAPIHLPDSAVIVSIEAWMYDNDATYTGTVGIYKSAPGASGSSLVTNSSLSTPVGGAGFSYISYGPNVINETIDNFGQRYFVTFRGIQSNSAIRLADVRIGYTVKKAD